MAVMTVTNVEQNATAAPHTSQVAAWKAADPASLKAIIPSIITVAAATVGMWYAYKYAIKPTTIGIAKSYVPYAAVIAVTAALERLLEPLSQQLMPSTAAKAEAAESRTAAQADAAKDRK